MQISRLESTSEISRDALELYFLKYVADSDSKALHDVVNVECTAVNVADIGEYFDVDYYVVADDADPLVDYFVEQVEMRRA